MAVGGGGDAGALSNENVLFMDCRVNGAALSLGLRQAGIEMHGFRSSGAIVVHQQSAATASFGGCMTAVILPKCGRRSRPWLGGIADRARLDRGQMA
jgi:hypothetical protein